MTGPSALAFDTFYHIFNRGNNRENIFIEEPNYSYFMRLYGQYIPPVAETWAFCCLRNHFHLFVKIRSRSEISDAMAVFSPEEEHRLLHTPSRHFSNFFNAYSKAVNRVYHRTGSLFQHPFKRKAVADPRYFRRVITYIHQNPQRHGLVSDYREWPFSSFHSYRAKEERPIVGDVIPRFFQDSKEYRKIHSQKTYPGTILPLLIDDFS